MRTVQIKRGDLYRAVWERPLYEIAKDLGLSDVGLGKACRRMDVPTPLRGYWAKRRAGERIAAPKLPNPPDGIDEVVEVHVPGCEPRIEPISQPSVTVRKKLENPHRLVKATERELRGVKGDEYGRLQPSNRRGLDLRVSPAQLDRALLICDAVIKGIEHMGYSVEVEVGWSRKQETSAAILGERVRFFMREPSSKRRRRSHSVSGESSFSPGRIFTPTGRLELQIDEYVATSTSKSVRDRRPGAGIEEQLGKFIVGLHACAQVKRIERLAQEAYEKRREEELRQKEERQRSQAYQDWLREDLLRLVNARRDAENIRALLAGIGTAESGNEVSEAWVEWAKREADRIDPLSGSNPIARPLDPPESWRE